MNYYLLNLNYYKKVSFKFLTINLFEINPKILFKQMSELTNKYGN